MISQPNPAPLKSALSVTGAIEPVIRLPYIPLDRASQKVLVERLANCDSDDVVGSSRQLQLMTFGQFHSIL